MKKSQLILSLLAVAALSMATGCTPKTQTASKVAAVNPDAPVAPSAAGVHASDSCSLGCINDPMRVKTKG